MGRRVDSIGRARLGRKNPDRGRLKAKMGDRRRMHAQGKWLVRNPLFQRSLENMGIDVSRLSFAPGEHGDIDDVDLANKRES